MNTDPSAQVDLKRQRPKSFPKWLWIGSAALGLLMVGGLVIFSRWKFNSAVMSESVATPTDPAPLAAAPALGPQSAPVTMIEYADFGCPACWAWHQLGVLEQLRAKYGDQLRFIWRDHPVVTLLSPKAAEAGQCAHEQGKFWEFHDMVYEHDGAITVHDLEAYASAIGLNMAQFQACVTTRRYKERVIAERQEGFEQGYMGTPFFLVNDQLLVGPQSLSVFTELIDAQLNSFP